MGPYEEWIANELEEIEYLSSESQVKGHRLEQFIKILFEGIPGLNFEGSNKLNFFKTQEIDLIFWNDLEKFGLHFLDCPLIIECKSSKSPVSGRDVSYFATLLSDKGRYSGILVALEGITGDDTKKEAGFYHLTTSLVKGVSVLVITKEDLLALTSPADLVLLLRRRLTELVITQMLS